MRMAILYVHCSGVQVHVGTLTYFYEENNYQIVIDAIAQLLEIAISPGETLVAAMDRFDNLLIRTHRYELGLRSATLLSLQLHHGLRISEELHPLILQHTDGFLLLTIEW